MSDASTAGVVIEAVGSVLEIRLDRPDRKNALSIEAITALIGALEDAAIDPSLRVVVLRSTGSDFCAGADWVASNTAGGERPRTGSIQRRTPVQAHRLVELLMEIQLPVVAAVRGWAAGLGCQLALAADFTVASETSRFWEPFLDRGFTPDSGSTWLLPRFIGVARAKDMLMLGRKVSGAEAAAWGLIHSAVPDDELDGAVAAIVGRLVAGPTVALGLTKRLVHRALEGSFTEAMEAESVTLELSSRSPDFKEGLAAFRESRPPGFTGT